MIKCLERKYDKSNEPGFDSNITPVVASKSFL